MAKKPVKKAAKKKATKPLQAHSSVLISKREYFAGMALAQLAGYFSDEKDKTGNDRCAVACVAIADALIAKLDKPQK